MIHVYDSNLPRMRYMYVGWWSNSNSIEVNNELGKDNTHKMRKHHHRKGLYTLDIFAHNIAIKRYCGIDIF
jgi:hypothetical protein